MKTKRFKCRHCGRLLPVRVPGQKYCGEKRCQAARKKKWSRKRYESDPDYRLNQKESTAAWLEGRGGSAEYYRDYRIRKRRSEAQAAVKDVKRGSKQTPVEMAQQTACQPEEDGVASLFAGSASGLDASANRDASCQASSIKTGIYKILPSGANKDAFVAEIRVISNA